MKKNLTQNLSNFQELDSLKPIVRIKGFKQEGGGVNCLMKDFRKFWTRMKINAKSQKKQSDHPKYKTILT